MIGKLLFHIIAASLGFFVASKIVPNVQFISGSAVDLVVIGTLLGIVNLLIKPILKAITFPIRILTIGLFSLIINMFLVWVVADIFFPDIYQIHGVIALFWTTLIIWLMDYLAAEIYHRVRNNKKK